MTFKKLVMQSGAIPRCHSAQPGKWFRAVIPRSHCAEWVRTRSGYRYQPARAKDRGHSGGFVPFSCFCAIDA